MFFLSEAFFLRLKSVFVEMGLNVVRMWIPAMFYFAFTLLVAGGVLSLMVYTIFVIWLYR